MRRRTLLTKNNEWVEIDGIKWAKMNIGASGVTDTGLYFQWGDVSGYTADQVGTGSGQKFFGWADYKYNSGGTSTPSEADITKYNDRDHLVTLEASDDSAKLNLGTDWRMPTNEDFQKLINACNSGWTSDYQGSGVAGIILTDKTNPSKNLFFPAGGYCSNGRIEDENNSGKYWSSSLYETTYHSYASLLDFNTNTIDASANGARLYGNTVRAIYEPHEYVEIDGVKWAIMNVGANDITDYGLYFQWGDVQGYTAEQVGSGSGQKYFGWADYKYGNGEADETPEDMTKYQGIGSGKDGLTRLLLEDDAVRSIWGGKWRMPTTEEFQALGRVVTTAWTTNYQESGVAGLVCTVTADTVGNGETLFFPACGHAYFGQLFNVGEYIGYWSNSLDTTRVNYAFDTYSPNTEINWKTSSFRCGGFAIRGVYDDEDKYGYVDLGLPSGTLWAKKNIGASTETDRGLLYQWGNTTGVKEGDSFDFTSEKYHNTTQGGGVLMGDFEQGSIYDAATETLGIDWVIPTKEQFEELINDSYVTKQWTTNYMDKGVDGFLITSKSNGHTIFLPSTGWAQEDSQIIARTTSGYYSSTSLYPYLTHLHDWVLNFNDEGIDIEYKSRCNGQGIRPIVKQNDTHEYVEIGGLKWATMNIGASGITDTGLYFQWGDVQGYTAEQVSGSVVPFPHKRFSWEDYKYGNGTSTPGTTGMTKYNSTDGKTVLEASDDAAKANWGGAWRMPTTAEFEALRIATYTGWTVNYQGSGVAGMIFRDKTDVSKTLFFPAAGGCRSGGVYDGGSLGLYWSSSLNMSSVINSHGLYFYIGNCTTGYYNRSVGFTVRGVKD